MSRRGFLLVVLAALCWGTAGISGRLITGRGELRPLDVAWYRMAVAAVVLLTAQLLTARGARARRPSTPWTRPVWSRLVLVGAGLGGYQLAYFAAVAQAGVAIATLVALGLAPLLIAVGGAFLGHGRPDRATLTALAVALAGLVLLVGVSTGGPAGGGSTTAVLLGALLAGIAALGYALVTLGGAGVPAGVPVTLVAFCGGALLLTPVALATGVRFPADPGTLALLLYLGLVPSALAYWLFFTGIRSVPGPVAAIGTLLEPLTATALAAALLGERLTPTALAGGLLLLAAVATLYLRRMGDSNSRRPTSMQMHQTTKEHVSGEEPAAP